MPAASRPAAIEAKDACKRYLGRDLNGLRVGPSPGWIARRLEAVGLRPVNNAVDAANYVLFELGQPLHVFDADKLRGERVLIRRAKVGEKLKALDGKEYSLLDADLVIADASGPVALAGVIGGEPTGVTDKTVNVFLEAAHFDPGAVRRTSRRLAIRTDSSYRFERGADPEAAALASTRATELLLKLCGASALAPTDIYPDPEERSPIAVSAARINQILGSSYPQDRVDSALKNMAARVVPQQGQGLAFYPPSHRRDLETQWDLAEEVARHLGYDLIPAEAGPVKLQRPKPTPLTELVQDLRRRLQADRFYEAYNADFLSETQIRLLETIQGATHGKPIRVLNPLSEDQAYLRPTLLMGLLQNVVHNVSRGASGLRLFEIGRVYRLDGSEPVERTCLAGLQFGDFRQESHWKTKKETPEPSDHFYDVKGVLENLLGPYPGLRHTERPGDALFHSEVSLGLAAGELRLGVFGLLHPALLRRLDLRDVAAAFVIDLDSLAEISVPDLKLVPFSAFPSVVRDLSIVLADAVPYAKVRECLEGLENLSRLELIDLYTGQGVPSGKKSFTLRMIFTSSERTLRDGEVQDAIKMALDRLARNCGAALRA